MTLKARLAKLEHRQSINTKPGGSIIIEEGVTEDGAIERWKSINPNNPVPENLMIIMLVPFGNEH